MFYNLRYRFTPDEKRDGELAVRSMSVKAQTVYDESDPLFVYAYKNHEDSSDVGYVLQYAVELFGDVSVGLTFFEAQKMLEDLSDSINVC